MGNPVQHDFTRGNLGSVNRILLRFPIKQNVQFRNLRNPSAINLPIQGNRELHVYKRTTRMPHPPRLR